MSLLNGEIPRTEADRSSDFMLSGLSGLVSIGFGIKVIDAIQTKPPQWGAIASVTGGVAFALAGVAAHRWNLAFDTTSSGAGRSHSQTEK